jgi:NitT/TauT family transport system substrate-binding protein
MKIPIALGALLCALCIPHALRADEPVMLHVMTTPIENGAEVYYAKDMGFFDKAGLDVTIDTVQSGSAIAPAVISGASDIGLSSLVPLAIAHVKQFPLVLVAPGGEWTAIARNSALFVGKTSGIANGRGLNGKILATAGLGTLTEYATRKWIDENGGDASTVKFVEMPYPTMVEALRTGRVDGALVNEPFLSQAKAIGRLLGYPYDAVAARFLISGWFSTADWARAHPDAVARFAKVMRQTANWANDPANGATTVAILAKYTRADPAALGAMVHVHFADEMRAADVQPQIDVAAKYAPFPVFPAQAIMTASTPYAVQR